MKRITSVPVLLATFFFSGCSTGPETLSSANVPLGGQECRGVSAAACYFRNSPVKLIDEPVRLPGRRGARFYPLAEPLLFIDASQRTWAAERRTLTDGASIPSLFVPIVGDPRTPEFANAAAVHDAYCGIGNEARPEYHSQSWQTVHRMFYDALIVGGTPEIKAKVMFAAVWLGGPRWDAYDTEFDRIPAAIRTRGMKETRAFITGTSPDMPDLMRYLDWQEQRMKHAMHIGRPDGERAAPYAGSAGDDTVDPSGPGSVGGIGGSQGGATAGQSPSPP